MYKPRRYQDEALMRLCSLNTQEWRIVRARQYKIASSGYKEVPDCILLLSKNGSVFVCETRMPKVATKNKLLY